jgi:hypothetical protein
LKLLISTGDAANQSTPQNVNSLNGKVLRLNLDGTIPSDNPIVGNPLWSYGHRNAQGLVLGNGILYSSEHGPANDDEINIIEKGRNYGWPQVQGFCNSGSEQSFCSANNVKEPVIVRGDIHTNSAEGFFSIFKRGVHGVFHHISKGHLHRYCSEFEFRHNTRMKLGYTDGERAALIVTGAEGKRLTYKMPAGASEN